jgi:hypothetical protein
MHLRNGFDEILDPDGVEISQASVEEVALKNARDCMAGDVRAGRLELGHRIDVHDAAGTVVHSISFADAIEIVPA